MTKGWLTSVS